MSPRRAPSCRQLRALLPTYLDGALRTTALTRLSQHVAICPTCQRLLAELEATIHVLHTLHSEDLHSETQQALCEVFRSWHASTSPPRGPEPEELLLEVLGLPSERRALLVGNASRYWTEGFCRAAVARGFEQRFREPRFTLEFSNLAVVASEKLRKASPLPSNRDLAAWALSYRANAKRIVGDLSGARKDFRAAKRLLGGESGLRVTAEFLMLSSVLDYSLGHLDEALRACDAARRLFETLKDGKMVGAMLIERAELVRRQNNYEEALATLERGIALIDRIEDPRRWLGGVHNKVLLLVDLGLLQEAQETLTQIRPMYFELGDQRNLVRLRWLEGTMARAEGRLEAAGDAFNSVVEELSTTAPSYDWALASLDLGAVRLLQGRLLELRALLATLAEVVGSLPAGPGIRAAADWLREAAELGELTVAMLQRVSSYVKETRANPQLGFRETLADRERRRASE